VADAFLVAFAIGFGFDLCGALLAASSASTPLSGLALFPPWQFNSDKVTFAGYGYWTGLVALARIGSLRFVRKPVFSRLIQGGALLWVTIDAAVATMTIESVPDTGLIHYLGLLTFHGMLTAWFAWIGLVGLSLWEALWIAKAVPDASKTPFQLLTELQDLLGALVRGRFRDCSRLSALFRLRRQAMIGHAELSLAPMDSGMANTLKDLQERLQHAEPAAKEPLSPLTIVPSRTFWWSSRFVRACTWGFLVFVIFLLPILPDGLGGFVWQALTFPFPILSISVPIVSSVLIVVLLWRYLVAAGKLTVGEDMDGVMQFRSEQTLLKMCLGMIVLLVFYANLPSFYPLPNLVVASLHARTPNFSPAQFTLLLLLFAVAMSGLTSERSLRWRRAPLEERRKAVMRQVSSAIAAFAIAWACLGIYQPGVIALHQFEGVWLKGVMNGNGPNTAFVIAVEMMVLTGTVGLLLTKLLNAWSRRVEEFFVGDPARHKVQT